MSVLEFLGEKLFGQIPLLCVLWSEYLYHLRMFLLKPNPCCDGIKRWGLRKVIRSYGWSPHEWNSCPYKRDPREILVPSTIWGHNEKMASMNQEVGPHRTPALLKLWSWTSQPPELWEIDICCLQATQSMVFCDSHLNALRQGYYKQCHSEYSWPCLSVHTCPYCYWAYS